MAGSLEALSGEQISWDQENLSAPRRQHLAARYLAAATVAFSLTTLINSEADAASTSPDTPAATGNSADPIEAHFAAPGPYQTDFKVVDDSSGKAIYDVFHPDYKEMKSKSPIITWGNGTLAYPDKYKALLNHYASWGFTVIASTSDTTGSGLQILHAAEYAVRQNTTNGSVFHNKLNVNEVAAAGHSQGAAGAVMAADRDPSLIKDVVTFELPAPVWYSPTGLKLSRQVFHTSPDPNCPTEKVCTPNLKKLHMSIFFITSNGFWDNIIAPIDAEQAYYRQVQGTAALGIIKESNGVPVDHTSVQVNPEGFEGYTTAWFADELEHQKLAKDAFSEKHPELLRNPDWVGSKIKK